MLNPPQSFPVMVGDMDNTGSLNAQVIHQLTSAVRSKIAIQVRHWRPHQDQEVYVDYYSKVWGHLEMQMFCPLK